MSAYVEDPIILDSTGQELVTVLREVKTAIASGKDSETTTWKEIRANVRNGLGETLYPVGTKFYVYKYGNAASKSGTPLKYWLDAVAHNKHFLLKHGEKTADYSMTLQMHELLTDSMQFDAAENQYGKSLDTAVVAWKTYYSDTSGTVVTSPTGNPSENGYYEKNDTSTYPRSTYGSNNWKHSGIRKWLNADKGVASGSWWKATTPFDTAPAYASNLPFQALLADNASGDDSTLLDVVGPVTIRTYLSEIKNPDNSNYYLDADANSEYKVGSRLTYDITEDTFFLPSTKEVHCSTYNAPEEVSMEYYEKFSDYSSPISAWGKSDTNLLKHKQNSASSTYWWLRAANAGSANSVMIVYSDGYISYYGAVYGYGIAPLCTIY